MTRTIKGCYLKRHEYCRKLTKYAGKEDNVRVANGSWRAVIHETLSDSNLLWNLEHTWYLFFKGVR